MGRATQGVTLIALDGAPRSAACSASPRPTTTAAARAAARRTMPALPPREANAVPPMDEPLRALRSAIDEIDRRIVALLNERARLAQEVGRVKDASDLPVYRPEREAEVLRNAAAASTGRCRRRAGRRLPRGDVGLPGARAAHPGLLPRPGRDLLRVGGAQAVRLVGRIRALPVDRRGVRTVEAGGADFAIAPVENSTEGSITRTLDLLLATPLAIVAEVSLPVEHHLLTSSGGMQGVTRIAAHAQALAQCVNWLNQHYPTIERQPVASNGEAARLPRPTRPWRRSPARRPRAATAWYRWQATSRTTRPTGRVSSL